MKQIQVILFLLILTLTACTKAPPQPGNPAEVKTAFATVVYASGTVKADGKEIGIGDAVKADATITTGEKSRVEIVFNDKNILRFGPETVAKLGGEAASRKLNVERGTVYAVLRKLDKLSGPGFEIQTESAALGVRGTTFFVRVSQADKETYICTCNGQLGLSKADGSGAFESKAPHHEANVFRKTDSGITISKPGPGYDHGHTDADMESLAAKIGVTIDWTKVEGEAGAGETTGEY